MSTSINDPVGRTFAPVAPTAPATARVGAGRSGAALVVPSNVPADQAALTIFLPRLDEPDFAMLNQNLGTLSQSLTLGRLLNSRENVKLSSAEQATAIKKAKEQREIADKKAEEAKKVAGEGNVAGWCTAIGLLVATALAIGVTVASGGLATAGGSVVAGLVLMSVTAVQEVVNQGLKEGKVPTTSPLGEKKQLDISIGGLVDMAVDDQIAHGGIVVVEKRGDKYFDTRTGAEVTDTDSTAGRWVMTEDEVSDYKMAWSVATTIAVALVAIGLGLNATSGAGKLAEAFKDGTKTEQLIQGAAIAVDVEQGAAAIASASFNGELAEISRDTDRARAQKAFYDATIKSIAQRLGMAQDSVRDIFSKMNENYDMLSSSIARTDRTYQTMVQNI